ncbi:MAG: ABC transporter ATP-binding protein [Gammaproteobacteria bacterium]
MRRTLISLRHVGVQYRLRRGLKRKQFWALKDVSFDLYHAETLGVIGRNGCGKTTLLKVLAGITQPDVGSVIHNGCRAALLALHAGFVPYLTGRENATLGGLMLGFSRRDVQNQMDAIADFAELGEFFDEPMFKYSAGMKARLGFSVAFQLDPDVLLIDEILGVGDAEFRQKSAAVLTEKIKSDKTVVVVSHDPGTIRSLCDRVVWIENGRTRCEGTAEEVLLQYEAALSHCDPAARAERDQGTAKAKRV